MLIDLDSIKQGIASLGDMIAGIGSNDYIYTLDGDVEIISQFSVSVGTDNTWRKIFQFIPEYSGLVEVTVQTPAQRYYAILEWGKLTSAYLAGNAIHAQGEYLQTILQTQTGNNTGLPSGLGTIGADNTVFYESINNSNKVYSANAKVSFIVPVQKGQPVIGLSWGNAGGYCVTEIKANKKAL